MPRYTYVTCVSFGGDTPTAEFEVEVSFVMHWGRPETPPSYAHGGLPADPDEIDDVRLEKVDGQPRPWDRFDGRMSDDDLQDLILAEIDEADLHTAALEQEAEHSLDIDYERDRRRDDELMGAL